jgi:hypothetical protein
VRCTLIPILSLALVLITCGCDNSGSPTGPPVQPHADSDNQPALSPETEITSLIDGLDVTSLMKSKSTDSANLTTAGHFSDVAVAAGILFKYDNGDSPQKLMTQAVGGGVGWIDFDRDGLPDLLLGQGGKPLDSDRVTNPVDQMFRNNNGLSFNNVTAMCGVEESGFSQGLAVGDFDNDGFDDIYVTNVGRDSFYQNQGDGTFLNRTDSSELSNPLWAASAAWADLDQDGDLDLFVCNYTDYDPAHPVACFGSSGEPGVCHPDNVGAVPNQLFANNGDGTFSSIFESAGLAGSDSKSLGVVIADLDDDGLADIFVANDTMANQLFINNGTSTFTEKGVVSGCAVSVYGQNQASMGVAFGDYDHNGFPDLYVTHFTSDSNTLYRGLGRGAYHDVTQETGLHLPTMKTLGFGAVMADFNCDGNEELFVANGHIDDSFQRQGDDWKMSAQLFSWSGNHWTDCSAFAGPYFAEKRLGRGVATADFDNDGDIDLAISNQGDNTALLQNDREQGHWLKLAFHGIASNRRGIGVNVEIAQNDKRLSKQLAGGTSFCAAHQPALFFGLGDDGTDVSINVTWPNGNTTVIESTSVDQQLLIRESQP